MRHRRPTPRLVAAAVLGAVALAADESQPFPDWRDNPGRVEQFLRSATIVDSQKLPVGITRPVLLTLESGGRRVRAIFKSVNIYEPRMVFEDGTFEVNFRDSYKNEIAAYRLDRMLGTDLVPPTVERTVDGETGALRLWMENTVTESERQEQGLHAPDNQDWSNQVAAVRLLFNLTSNSDYNNINNLIVDPEFRIYVIDHSRAFRTKKKLVSETMLMRFSRPLLEELSALDQESLSTELGGYVSAVQVKALLKRRDLILKRVDKLVELKGESLVLFD